MKKKKFSKERITAETIGQDIEKKEPIKGKLGLFIVGGIVILMILSVFAISLGNKQEDAQGSTMEYNGYKFKSIQGLWTTELNGRQYGFEYAPNDLGNISSVEIKDVNFKSKTYVLFNPDEFTENSQEILRLRGFLATIGVLASPACAKEESCGDIPVLDCSNINNPVYLKLGNESKIYEEDNCIVLQTINGEESLVINKFMYKYLGII